MRTDRGTLEGDQIVSDVLTVFGMVAGDVTVAPGGYLVLFGLIAGHLRIQPHGRANISGTVAKSVTNDGTLRVAGIIQESLDGAGETLIEQGSFVNGVRH